MQPNMNIRKAVITAAGASQRGLPLQTLVDRDGVTKSALQLLIAEARGGGAEDIAVIVTPGDEGAFASAAGADADRLHFIPQHNPRGYADAILRARDFVDAQPFLHLVGDHLSIARGEISCARQLVTIAQRENCAVSAVQATREALLPNYGAVGGKRVGAHDLYAIEAVLEKPTPTVAEQTLLTPGLRSGHYLCFFGMHVLTPIIFDLIEERLTQANGPMSLSDALAGLANRERYLALEVAGSRYNIGVKYGLLNAQLALALSGPDRANVLAQLVELLAQ
jgi:UTP--glucose-1-phosphate uridylyltransferase